MAATTAPSGAGSAAMLPNTTAAPNSQTPGHPSFRRQRASRACEVRCDAANLGVPCTNCTAFAIECRIPAPKRKKTSGKTKDSDSENAESTHAPSPTIENPAGYDIQQSNPADFRNPLQNGMPATTLSDAQTLQQATHNTHFAQFMKPKFARAPIKEAGRVAYLGESSNLSLLVHDRHGTTDVVHYPLPDTVKGSRARMTDLDNLEIEILHQRGAFLLPPRALCDELVESYFKWVAPVVPVINKTRFMQRYRDAKNPPSLLLLQAMLLAGSRVCTNPQLMDANGSTTPAAMTFYKRAKALYDANYEDDRVTIVQALVLMGWYWEGPEDVTKNVFYWTRVATIVAQGSGMHRSVEGSQLSRPDKRLWKRIWWTLFTRDRSVAVALGRPVHINTDDSDVEMVSEDDFIEDEDDQPSKFPPDSVHVQFFLQYVRLCEIMGLVLSQQYSVASKARRQNAIDLTHSDMALADWLQNCPKEVYWEKPRHHFWSALLHSNYYTTLCLLHRAHMPPATYESNGHNGYPTDAAYPSRNIAFQAAGMITSIIESLIAHDELKFTPAFIVYSLFSALIMHVYQMRSSVPSIVTATQERMQVCMNALKEVSKVWLVAKMVHTLFESILGNKMLEDRLQKAAGKKHKKPRLEARPEKDDQSQKRKYDEMELGFTNNGPPAPAMSYERSRPQTPAVTPSQDVGQSAPVAPMAAPPTSPRLRQSNDAFMGGSGSRANTRPPTPFNPSYSVPPTPPDLFLVTRDSPHISQSLWENFQPDQLFPGGTDMSLPPYNAQPNLDPQLQMPPMQQSTMLQPPTMPGHQPIPSRAMHGSHDGQASIHNIQDVAGLPHMQGMQQPNTNPGWPGQYPGDGSPEDTWSNSGRSQAPVAPTTLNVEDWFQFFGMNGDMSGMNGDAINNLLSVPDVTRTEKSTASACGAMNAERPSVTSRNSATTLRSRTRHQAQDDRAYESIVENRSRTSSQSRSPLRDASPIPSKHPSRPARNLHKSTGSDRPLAPQSLFSSQILPNTFATGLWETSWASLQGIASNLLGNETSRSSSKASSPNRKSRPPHTTRGEESKALSRQWGPQATEQRLIGVGTKEDRLAKVQAKKRETLLSANGHINPDGSGRFKRRDSDERVAASAPPSQFEDREALVYLHKVKPEDTLAGVMIKYNCNAPIFRKANRLWPNDRIQIRKVVYLPVDACAVRAHKLSDAEVQMNGLFCSHNEEIIRTPTNVHVPWLSSQSTSETSETIHSSVPTSPSISIFPPDEQPWTHDSWVTLPNLSVPVEVARLSRRSLGFFPPSRRKSVSYTDLETPSASLELPRKDPRTDSRRRDRDRSGSSSGSYFIDRLQGPGGVGTLGREVRSPGPAQDSLNKLFAAHLPNVAPRASFESVHSNSSHGIENMGGAIEGWMRKIASKAKESVQSPAHGPKPGTGDLIELTDAFEVGANDDEHSTERDDDADPATQPALGTWKDDQERLLRERFPPRGRVFAQSPRRKGV